jgi:hypothetical protein
MEGLITNMSPFAAVPGAAVPGAVEPTGAAPGEPVVDGAMGLTPARETPVPFEDEEHAPKANTIMHAAYFKPRLPFMSPSISHPSAKPRARYADLLVQVDSICSQSNSAASVGTT